MLVTAFQAQKLIEAFLINLQVFPPEIVLLVLYLASLVLRESLTPMELLGFALNGDLPFFQELSNACEQVDGDNLLKLHVLLKRVGKCKENVVLRLVCAHTDVLKRLKVATWALTFDDMILLLCQACLVPNFP